MNVTTHTQVGIIGAGPAGLMLGHLLQLHGIESVVLENRTREYVEQRVRAGVLEHNTVELMKSTGVGNRLTERGLVHHGIELRFGRRRHRIAMSELTGGRTITIYAQQEVVKDLAAARLAADGPIHYEVNDVRLSELDTRHPTISFQVENQSVRLICDFIAGCDGFHGVSRAAIPREALKVYEWTYPFAWLGILAAVPPSTGELIYARHPRGFALHSLRSPEISRLYLQCGPNDDIGQWSDDQIWSELQRRFETDDGWELHEGPILEKSITPMRSFVVEPMSYQRLFLAGDAAHIVPPTGAKGLNLAVNDVRILARALSDFYTSGDTVGISEYSSSCLQRVWRVQQFSSWMTALLHRGSEGDQELDDRLRRSELSYIVGSQAGSTMLAENYVGLPYAEQLPYAK